MRRFTMFVAMAAVAVVANVAMAGDYHVGRLLVCADCHIAHASQTHGENTDADTIYTAPPSDKLIRGETFSNACLNCHDGKAGIPDVLQAPTDLYTNGRSAGALNVPTGGLHGKTQVAPYTQGDGHTLWSTTLPPGYVGHASSNATPMISTDGLQCTDCHRAHGAKYFRNMMGDVSTSTATYINSNWFGKEVTYEISATPSTTPTVWVLEKAAHTYDNDNVQYYEKSDQLTSEYGRWCSTCHETFHGNLTDTDIENGAGEVVRHPTAGVDFSPASWANVAPTHRLKVMSGNGTWAADSASASLDLTPSCFTCHKSHGNANKFGLIFVLPRASSSAPAAANAALKDPTRLASMTEEGDGGQYRDMCRNCHGQGRFPSGNPTNIYP